MDNINPMPLGIFFLGIIICTAMCFHPAMLIVSWMGAFIMLGTLKGVLYALKRNLFVALPAAIVLSLINPLFNHYGVTVIFYLPSGNAFTLEAVCYGLVLSCIIVVEIQWAYLMSIVMTADRLLYIFGHITPYFSLTLSIALRFIPRFLVQLKKIRCAKKTISFGNPQKSKKYTFILRVRQGFSDFFALLSWSLEHSVKTAGAMKAKGYGSSKMTSFSLFLFTLKDACYTAIFSTGFIFIFAMLVSGRFRALYNPVIEIPAPFSNAADIATYAVFIFLSLFCAVRTMIISARLKGRSNASGSINGGYRLWEN